MGTRIVNDKGRYPFTDNLDVIAISFLSDSGYRVSIRSSGKGGGKACRHSEHARQTLR
jgi:hypothetical protein